MPEKVKQTSENQPAGDEAPKAAARARAVRNEPAAKALPEFQNEIARMGEAMPERFAELQSAYFRNLASLGEELFGFMSRRMQAQAEQMHLLCQCKSLPEMFQAQASFAQATVEDYRRETEQLVTAGQSMARDAVARLDKAA